MDFSGARHHNLLPAPDPPIAPDFHLCHPFYGESLAQWDCEEAASRLPVGGIPIRIVSHDYPYYFPIGESSGPNGCRITVRWAYPDSFHATGQLSVAPDAFRTMASWLISTCVVQSAWGGFGTISLGNMINWIADNSTPLDQVGNGPWPAFVSYFTVTVDKDDTPEAFDSGFYDPITGAELGFGLRQKGNLERANELDSTACKMQRSFEGMAWWLPFKNEKGPEIGENEMAYTCETDLGAPNAVDCTQLAFSGLGPPSDTVTVGPEAAKVLSLKTCHAAITAIHTIVLTWSQISAALNTLLDVCVTHPWLASRGGRAFNQNSRTSKLAKRTSAFTGLDALPPGVNITVSG